MNEIICNESSGWGPGPVHKNNEDIFFKPMTLMLYR